MHFVRSVHRQGELDEACKSKSAHTYDLCTIPDDTSLPPRLQLFVTWRPRKKLSASMPSATACRFTRDPSPSDPSTQNRCSRNAADSSDAARLTPPLLLSPSPAFSRLSSDLTKS